MDSDNKVDMQLCRPINGLHQITLRFFGCEINEIILLILVVHCSQQEKEICLMMIFYSSLT